MTVVDTKLNDAFQIMHAFHHPFAHAGSPEAEHEVVITTASIRPASKRLVDR